MHGTQKSWRGTESPPTITLQSRLYTGHPLLCQIIYLKDLCH